LVKNPINVITRVELWVDAPIDASVDALPPTRTALAKHREGGQMKLPVATDPDDRTWQDYANCLGVDPDLFFPERGASTREAKEVCRGCIVRAQCLEYALVNSEKFGIWGGMSERERRRIRRQRSLARQAAAAGA
jgi:WhiB family redox-sensing transcriptional regulator